MPRQLLITIFDEADNWEVSILSVLNDKLLVSSFSFQKMFIVNLEGEHLSTILTNTNDELLDATWTGSGTIVYTTFKISKVVLMSDAGKVLTSHNDLGKPSHLSIGNDDIIYLTDYDSGVYQSRDDGNSWKHLFKSTKGWRCRHAIKVSIGHIDNFWTLEDDDSKNHMRVYSFDRRHSVPNITYRDISFPSTEDKPINVPLSKLAYDKKRIYLSDMDNKAVYMFSSDGARHSRILSSDQLLDKPLSMKVDKTGKFLFIGQLGGLAIFDLK